MQFIFSKIIKFITKLKTLVLSSRLLKVFAPDIVGVSVLACIVIVIFLSSAHQSISSKKPVVSKPVSKTQVTKQLPKIVMSTKPAPVPTPVATPKPVVSRPVSTYVPAPTHAVVPSPSSSVSSLTPTNSSPPTVPSGGSGGSGNSTPATGGYTSLNWSGYMATTASYSSVSASWVAPSATGNGTSTTADATWVGIGGITTSDLIQVGTSNIVSAGGQVSTSAFYEMLPNVSITIPGVSVSPGDSITASVTEISSSLWTIYLKDNTDNETFSQNVTYASTNSSAEWIEEEPSYASRQLIPLDNFSTASFTNCLTTAGGNSENLNASSSQPITLVTSSNTAEATPTIIGSDGASFSVARN